AEPPSTGVRMSTTVPVNGKSARLKKAAGRVKSRSPSGENGALDQLDLNQLYRVLTAVRKGYFTARMPVDQTGVAAKINDALNDVIELNEGMAREVKRVSNAVGKEGKIAQRATLPRAAGSWASSVESVN